MLKLIQGGHEAPQADSLNTEERIRVRSQEIATDLQGCLEGIPEAAAQAMTLAFLIRRIALLELARQ